MSAEGSLRKSIRLLLHDYLIAFQPEVLYSQKGAKVPDRTTDITRRFHYIDVPLVFHLNTGGLFFEAGPQVGFLIKAEDKAGSTTTTAVENTYNILDLGYVAGLGYQRKRGLGIGLRYNGGITNFQRSATTNGVTVQPRVHNDAFQLYLTYSVSAR